VPYLKRTLSGRSCAWAGQRVLESVYLCRRGWFQLPVHPAEPGRDPAATTSITPVIPVSSTTRESASASRTWPSYRATSPV